MPRRWLLVPFVSFVCLFAVPAMGPSKVKIIHQVDDVKLAALRPDNPSAYRDYAAELAKKSSEPGAKELARRLYLIAAFHASGDLRRDCLLSMCAVAKNAAEARRIRALAYLLDPKRNSAFLKHEPVGAWNDSWNDFRKTLRYLRSGKVASALTYAKKPGVAECFKNVPDFVDIKNFEKMCEKVKCKCKGLGWVRAKNGPVICPDCDGRGVFEDLTESQLRMILKIELRLEKKDFNPDRKNPGSSWSVQLSRGRVDPVRELSLETVTEINPRECIYRDGKWVAP